MNCQHLPPTDGELASPCLVDARMVAYQNQTRSMGPNLQGRGGAMRSVHVRRLLAGVVLLAAGSPLLFGQAPAPQDLDEEVARQRQIVDRFLTVLERTPR